ncbi:MAG: N-(5'-phosphoribosyl)anthranilate isomerase [Candidatus Heimdallarchaeota archaeon LC_3]|nr:MAG: N-(5'-phosphoribosyl)anthranilate isomerase [Candidatus Heimdallarchaeota archaeon LC_3]
MKTQIYIASKEDVKICIDAGVDFIGVVADDKGKTPSSVPSQQVKQIFQSIPDTKMRVALIIEKEFESIKQIIDITNPDLLHIGFEPEKISLSVIERLRNEFPKIKLMQAIPINNKNPIDSALKFQHSVDFFILDTNDPNRIDLGATGLTHDWNISAELAEKVKIPAILAGGLTPENVSEAIKVVKPWGVDSFSKTNLDNTNRKDKVKVEKFVKNAKTVF